MRCRTIWVSIIRGDNHFNIMSSRYELEVTFKKGTSKEKQQECAPWIRQVLEEVNAPGTDDFPAPIDFVIIRRIPQDGQ